MATGMENAPVMKGVLLATAGASIFAQAARASRRHMPAFLQLPARLLVLRNPGELVFGVFMLYYFRVLERQSGSAKFGAFAAVATGLSSALQLALTKAWQRLGGGGGPAAAAAAAGPAAAAFGPYGLIFACLVQFAVNIPPSNQFTLFGCKLSDKAFTYLAGLQLLLMGGSPTIIAGAAGLMAGCLYRANVLGIKKFRFPKALSSFLSRTLGPLLRDQRHPPQAAADSSTAGQRAARPPGSHHQHHQHHTRGTTSTSTTAQLHGQGQGGVPAVPPATAAAAAASEDALHRLMEMGFDRGQALLALQAAGNDVDLAISLLVGGS